MASQARLGCAAIICTYCPAIACSCEALEDCNGSPWQGTGSLAVHHSWASLPAIGTLAVLCRRRSDLEWDKLCSQEAGAQCRRMPPAPSLPAP